MGQAQRERLGVILHGHIGGKSGRDGLGGMYDPAATVQSLSPLLARFDCSVFGHLWTSSLGARDFPVDWVVIDEPQMRFDLPENFESLRMAPELMSIRRKHHNAEDYIKALALRGSSRWESLRRAVELAARMNNPPDAWLVTRFDIDLSRSFVVPKVENGSVAVGRRQSDHLIALNDLIFLVSNTNLRQLSALGALGSSLSIRPPVALMRFVQSEGLLPFVAWRQGWHFDLRRNRGLVSTFKGKFVKGPPVRKSPY